MDLKTIVRSVVKYICPPQRIIVGVFAFSAVVNAFALRHSVDLILPVSESVYCEKPLVNEEPTFLRNLEKRLKFRYHADIDLYEKKWKWRKRKWTDKNINQNPNLLFLADYNRARQRHFLVLISFYVGYIIGHIPGTIFTERCSGKWVLALALLLSALCTLITPFIIKCWGINGLLVLRFLMGLSQGPIFPAITHLISNWIPPNERGCLLAIVLSSGHMAILLVNLLFGFLITNFEWYAMFYFIAAGALLWFIGFILFCFNEPESNPYINETELHYLQETVSSFRDLQPSQSSQRPWLQVLMSPSLWALILATIQHDWSQSLILSELHDVLHDFNLWPNFGSCLKICLPLFLNWLISLLAGFISDILVQKEILSTSEARQLMTLFAAFGPRICSNLSNCVLCDNETYDLNNIIINCTMGLIGIYYAGAKLNALDMDPTYAGTVMAIANGLGSLGSILAYYLDDLVKNSEFLQNVRSLLWLIITMLTSGELQDTDRNVLTKN